MSDKDREAFLYFGDGQLDIMKPGDHVRCAVTGLKIPLHQIKYWSVEQQEAYLNAEVASRRNDHPSEKMSA